MGKTLIITEKPSVAREYASILHVSGKGDGVIENESYVITWCYGHLVEMSYPDAYDEKFKKWNMNDLPFLPEEYKYAVIPSAKKQYKVVNGCLHREDVSEVLWAGDSGREGQVIEELIRMQGGVRTGLKERRVWIDSTTEDEIKRGMEEAKPYEDYRNLANAGIMRAIEDYSMGINFSRVLSVKYGRMMNEAAGTKKYAAIAVGRVMSCVLGMVVRREREIRAFAETPFYKLQAVFRKGEASFTGEWKAVKGSAYFESPLLYSEKGFKEEKDARALIDSMSEFKSGLIFKTDRKDENRKPPLLYNLAELQAACSKRFKISPDQTLDIAQTLYEAKLTTYPRTDARVLTTAVAKEITKNLGGLYRYSPVSEFVLKIRDDKLYTGLEKSMYVDDSKVTDHYAIIPTGDVSRLASMSELQRSVYDMIVRRFLSIFYPPAVFEKVQITTAVSREKFFTNVKVLKSPGFYEITGQDKPKKTDPEDDDRSKDEDEVSTSAELLTLLSGLKKGDIADLDGITIKEGKTSPPKRYNSGTMILAMENAGQLIEDEELRAEIKGAGIGTSATRAGIIEKLVKNDYLKLNKKTQILTPSVMGEMIYEIVLMTIPSMLEPKMTASWEKGLSQLEQGDISPEVYRDKLEQYVTKYVNSVKSRNLQAAIAVKLRQVTEVNKTTGGAGKKTSGKKGAGKKTADKQTGGKETNGEQGGDKQTAGKKTADKQTADKQTGGKQDAGS
ncbi:MAG: DNA topoisomerase III [Lachnospiraceae bacterium]|nr:DNA topoisomerase III [Lachnospiraceae bacterium]